MKVKSAFSFIKGNVLVQFVTNTIIFFAGSMSEPFFSLYVLALDGKAPIIGSIYALGALASLIISPVSGYIADYVGRVKLILIGSCFQPLPFLILSLAPNWQTLAIGRFFRSVTTFHLPILSTIMADSLPRERRGAGFAMVSTLPRSLALASPYIAGYLIELMGVEFSMRILYAYCFISWVAVATIRFKFLRETLNEHESNVRLSPSDFPHLLKTSYINAWNALKQTPTSIKSIIGISVLNKFFASMAEAFWIVYALIIIQLSTVDWGMIILISNLLSIVLSTPLGLLIDRFGKRKTIISALAISPLPALFFIYSNTFLSTLAVIMPITVINCITIPAFQALIADLVPREKRGRIMAALGGGRAGVTAGFGGGSWVGIGFLLAAPISIGSFVGGYVYDLNPTYPFLILSLSLALCLALCVAYVYEPKKPEE